MITVIPFDYLHDWEQPFWDRDNVNATEEERETAKELSMEYTEPVAFLRDGALLTGHDCRGSAGTFPLVCKRGKIAYWDSETYHISGGAPDIPRNNTGLFMRPNTAAANYSTRLNLMGQTFYGGWYAKRWHITDFK